MNNANSTHCTNCKRNVGYHFNRENQWKHLFLTIITFGIWVPMWLMVIFSPTKICDECNEPIWKS